MASKSPWAISDADLEAVLSKDFEPVMQQIQRQVMDILADGRPVTLIYNGKALTTLYPWGKVVSHYDP